MNWDFIKSKISIARLFGGNVQDINAGQNINSRLVASPFNDKGALNPFAKSIPMSWTYSNAFCTGMSPLKLADRLEHVQFGFEPPKQSQKINVNKDKNSLDKLVFHTAMSFEKRDGSHSQFGIIRMDDGENYLLTKQQTRDNGEKEYFISKSLGNYKSPVDALIAVNSNTAAMPAIRKAPKIFCAVELNLNPLPYSAARLVLS